MESPPKLATERVMVIHENLEKLKVPELKKLMTRENIPIPLKGSGKNKNVLKGDLIRAIQDFQSQFEKTEAITISSPQAYENLSTSNLRDICTQRGIDSKKCKLTRDELIAVLQRWDMTQFPSRTPSPIGKRGRTPSPVRKRGRQYKCGTKKNPTCGKTQICDVETGKCFKRIKDSYHGRARKRLETEYGDDYYFDEEHGLVGRKDDVIDHLKYWGLLVTPPPSKKAKKTRTPSPKQVKKAKKARTPSPKQVKKTSPSRFPERIQGMKCANLKGPKCDPGYLCEAITGDCVKGSSKIIESKYILKTNDGRLIYGTKNLMSKLQKILGGEVTRKKLSPPPEMEEILLPLEESPLLEEEVSPYMEEETLVPITLPPSPKKPSPKKPSPKKAKKPSPKKPSPKKAKKCTDKKHYLRCKKNQVCEAETGKCVEDTKDRDKYILKTDDERIIVGNRSTIYQLQKTLGGVIKSPKEEVSPVISIEKRIRKLEKEKKEASPVVSIEKRIRKLEKEDEDWEEEKEKMQERLEALKKKKTAGSRRQKTSPLLIPLQGTPPKPPSYKLESSKEDIAATFAKCIASLS